MKEKKLLIVERSNATLKYQVEDVLNENNEHRDSIVLTGLFTSFDTKNRNGRIYESADFLPHVENLREQIESKRLLGELDHPHGFEVSLGNVSHVVESLEYDPQQNAIIGKIRLLNTSKGLEAQALIKDGIPLNISSRAAGTVDESGRVRLQQLFTYDLVADPGFANAQLKRVNESYGFGDASNIDIYDISEDANTNLDPNVTKTADYAEPQAVKNEDTLNNKNTMEEPNTEFVQYGDFQKYTTHLAEVITDLQSLASNLQSEVASMKGGSNTSQEFDSANVDNSKIADLIAKVGELESIVKVSKDGAAVSGTVTSEAPSENAEKVAELEAKAEAMEEKFNNLMAYTKYLAETLDKSITHTDYVTDEANKIIEHNNYLAENMNKMIGHQDYLAEKMTQMIAHQDYLAENMNDTISYQNYVAEMLDKSIDYSNMLSEEMNKSIAHQDYLAEKMTQMIDHQDYIVEEVNKMGENLIEEKKDNKGIETPVVETPVNESNVPTVEKKPVFNHKEYQSAIDEKLSAILTTVETQYNEAKEKEAEAIKESKKNIDTTNFTLINYMPERLAERWSKLSDERKKEILAESKMFVINNEASAVYFWNTRDMRDKQIEMKKVEESVTATPSNSVNENVVSDDRLKAMSARIQRAMRKF